MTYSFKIKSKLVFILACALSKASNIQKKKTNSKASAQTFHKITYSTDIKFSDGDGPNLCRVKKQMLVPHLLKIYFGLG